MGACLLALLARPAWCGFQNFGLADGLADTRVTAVAQDTDENVWFAHGRGDGTGHGVSRYDGAFFKSFSHSQGDGLASDDVRGVLPDRNGRVWFATSQGVSRYDHGTWTTFEFGGGLVSNNVTALIDDHLGRFWFATGDEGVSRYDGTTWTTYQQQDGLASNNVSCLHEDRAGNLWFGTRGGGLSRFDGMTWTTYTTVSTSNGLSGDWINCILQTRDGAMWFGTQTFGLSRFDGTTWTHFATAGALSLVDVTALSEDAAGLLWVGSSTGVARYDGRSWRAYTTADGLPATTVAALTIDRSGNRWIGTDNGVCRYDGESWTGYLDAGLTYGAQSIVEDRHGNVWAATPGAGVARYDRSAWSSVTNASTSGGLASDAVSAVLEDSTGAMWFGTSAGASRFDGNTWHTFVPADGLAGSNVTALARDPSGGVWFGTTLGLSRYDGSTWTTYTSANGLPANRVRSLCVDRTGRVWCGTSAGVAVLGGGTWTTYTTANGLADNNVYAVFQDPANAMWFGTTAGLSRFDGATWRTYHTQDGLAGDWVLSITATPDSVLWIGTTGSGVSRFDGEVWKTYTNQDGLPSGTVSAALVERSGSLWFGTRLGAALYEPARVPPQTVITSAPPPLSANTLQTVHFQAAYRQVLGIEFSTSLDAAPWSPFGPEDTWVGRDLADGVHTLRVVARDALHHIDATPAACTFEVAATPPAPIITSPVFRQPVRDTLVVSGTAQALRFRSFRVDVRPASATSWDPPAATTLAQSTTPVTAGHLARLATRALPDGDYELRLAVQDTLGLTGVAQVTFIVDNVAPFAAQTTPALVSALNGGDVFTTNREAHVYIPPRGLQRDATVSLDALDDAAVPATLPDGAVRWAPAFAIGTEGVALAKEAVLDMVVLAQGAGGSAMPAGSRLAFYTKAPDGEWRRVGGTVDPTGARITTSIPGAGSYAVFAAPPGASDVAPKLALALTPRVFSSRAGFANAPVRVSFTLPREGSVRVTIHNRAGRLIRVVTSGQTYGAGTNVVSWDGRNDDHEDVDSGTYLVTVEALGDQRTEVLAVVR